jgi:hypothetical protein
MKAEETEFVIPGNFIDKLYELSGGADTYKGLILILCNERGDPVIYSRCGSTVVELGLKKTLEGFLKDELEAED